MNFRSFLVQKRTLSPTRWLLLWSVCAIGTLFTLLFIRIGLNETGSLNRKVFLVVKGKIPTERGDYVVFRWGGQGGFYKPGVLFTKLIEGVPGDRVSVEADGLVTVSGRSIGYAKPVASNGTKLEAIDPGVIPPGFLFVRGQSDNSLDSRYKLVGLIKRDHVFGMAYAIF